MPLKSTPLLPAEATNITPAAAAGQIALCSESLLTLPQLASSAPAPPMLMFATLRFSTAALAVTQSIPHRNCESVPTARLFSTLTA